MYNSQIKKLDLKMVSGYYISYTVNSKGYRFYCPNQISKIVEARNAKFLEDYELSGSSFFIKMNLRK